MEINPDKENDMIRSDHTSEHPASDWRLKSGIGLFILSIAAPLIGIPAVTAFNLSATVTAALSGVLLVGSEIVGVLAVAVMGKNGYTYIKNCVLGFLKQYGPPEEVSRLRYNIGLVMFSVPVLFGWVSIYAAQLIPGFTKNPLPFALSGDILLLASLVPTFQFPKKPSPTLYLFSELPAISTLEIGK